ncbi:MAG TPA: glutamyl-tRNA reductase, partial [Burkholderiales bacterium]|nr:glutamyl-tRNA reductase [Burkholderiales bacterium]
CNRVEFYFVTREPATLERAATTWLSGFVAPPLLRTKAGLATCDHLLRVASGVESMLVGEDQVLGQVRDAYEQSVSAGAAGRHLNRLFSKAIQVGKKVRTETSINEGSVSVGGAAVRLAAGEGSLADKRVVIVGTGEMATLIAKSLADERPAQIVVVSKTAARASDLAQRVGGLPSSFQEMASRISDFDLVITATSGTETLFDDTLLSNLMAGRQAGDRPLLFLDVSNPRAVDPSVTRIPGVRLSDIDSLRAIAADNMDRRRAQVARAESIIAEELALLSARLSEERAEAILSQLYGKTKEIRDRELDRALSKANLGANDRKIVADLANSILNKVLAEPTLALKRMARENDAAGIDLAAELFGLGREK